ncbi:MAG TPA: lamin tail domain-containing protein [Verrucomicrobiae bacterium]|nr:lamin tail domain-containing protein [Verrucomicrobiae bacterium]
MTLLSCLLAGAAQGQLPANWSDQDIGSPSQPGSASFANGIWSVAGGGADIWTASDQFHFAYETSSSAITMQARVTSVQNTDPWAKAGLMLRDSTDPAAVFADVVATPGNGVSFQWRAATAGQCGYSQVSGISIPVWLKLTRSGDQFSAYYSPDGAAWTSIGPSETITMVDTPLAGLAVTAHNDAFLCSASFDNLVISNTPAPPPNPFGVYRQLWSNLDPNVGNSLAALTNTTDNPNWPDNPDPNYTRTYSNFEADSNIGMNYYGQRMRAFVIPPTNGNYTFWIASDDSSDLFLSTDESPLNKKIIAWVATWTASREWTKEPNQQSTPITLEAGRRYYMEAIMQQGTGGDNLAVRWQMPGGAFEEPIPSSSAAGTLLVPCDGVESPPGIFEQTPNLTVVEGRSAAFSVVCTNGNSVSYFWQLNGKPVPGANQPVYSINNVTVAGNNGQVYSCLVSNSFGTASSASITLTVVPDTVPPTVTRLLNIGTNSVVVVYSKPVQASSSTNTSNYSFTNGLVISSASLAADNQTVTLTTSPLVYGSNYTLVINGVRDRASTPNTIAPNTTVSFIALPYSAQDIGGPPFPTSVAVSGNGLNISASGSDIGGYSDQFGLSYQLRTGDFDLAVRVVGVSASDVWAKAGLMARETLDPASRFAGVFATPAMNGMFFESRDPASSASVTSGNLGANYPNTWVRLKRTGNTFTGYGSYDGLTWSQLGSATISMPSLIYFGYAVSSHNPGQSTLAQFRDSFTVTNPVVGTVSLAREPLGPSSRKTPIAITEIMYKPAPRTDGNNVEFIELYNSNPWFQDISNYKLQGSTLSYTFPPGTILQGGAFLVIAASPSGIQNVYGITNVMGPYTGSLKKTDTLELFDEVGALLLSVPYSNVAPWPVAADGVGHSLVLTSPTYGEADPRAWAISDIVGGSPGQMDAYRASPLRNVVINEFLAHTDPPQYDYIELYNHANQPVDISGCVLTDDPTTNKFVIPAGTLIPGRGFVFYSETNMNFRLNAAGETIYFKNPDQSRVLDAVQFGGQENGVATGRWPDGAPEFYRLSTTTPGAANSGILIGNIVINELMYNPITGNDDDQYVELYNRGTNKVDLGGWKLSGGVGFTFATNTTLAAGGYLVVARNAGRMLTNYPNLNAGNCVGNFTGKLSHNGEYLALSKPDTVVQTNSSGVVATNLIAIVVNDLTYGTGGRWGQWSSGGGSSLELVDVNSNNRLAANWADSDESQKSSWVNIETTGVLDNGQNYDPSIDYAQIGLLDVGECLVDNIEVRAGTAGANLVLNPDFESGLGNWSLQGDHVRSSLENSGYSSSHSLHIRCTDRIWTGDNSCQVALSANSLSSGQTATLRFKARWLHGWPEALLRLNGNWLEATGPMPVPANLGTPGARNSRASANTGPAVYEVTHNPPVPAAAQAAIVSARVHDSDGVAALTLYYRLDPSSSYAAVAMKDDGTGGDGIAGDGIYSATIPGQAANSIVAFYIQAQDNRAAITRFPTVLNPTAPVPECVVMFGDSNPAGSFGVYHLWVTQTNATRWSQLSDLSNESHDCTIVNGTRVIYNAQARFAGSPYHQGFDTPYGNLCHYKWIFPDDDKFLGATSFNKIHQPGNGAGDDSSIQREQLANTFLRALGVPWLNRRYVAVFVNGNRRGTLMEDAQTPDSDVVKEHFPNDSGGWLYKMQPWFEFGPFPSGNSIPFNNESWCNLMPYTTSGGAKKVARYRYNFLSRRTPTSASDYTNVFSLIDAAGSYGTPGYVGNMENMADMENWMRVFAANHAAGNWDAFGCQNAQNLYGYIGTQGTRYSLLMFDYNIVIGNSGSWGPGQNLFSVNGQDPNTQNIYNEPTFRRMYWRALQELVNGPLDLSKSGPLVDAKYNAFVANGLNVEDPNSSIKSWLSQAHDSIASQIAVENASSFSLSQNVTVNSDVATLTGTAPVGVKTVLINGAQYPLIWTSVTGFQIQVPLKQGNNALTVVGVDIHGQPVAGTSNLLNVVNGTAVPSPVGQVVINEIMYRPTQPGAEFVELYNNSSSTMFDLSGWQVKELGYTFPQGATISPNSYLVLAANRAAFAAAYGATIPVFDSYGTVGQANGGTLTLSQPQTNAELVIAKVRYGSNPPWPAGAAGRGSSLQLVDSHQDNWRAGNWSGAFPPASYSPAAANPIATTLPAFQPLWINEVQADNLTGPTNSAGRHTPWLELFNPSQATVSLSGLYLSTNYSNLTNWAFPSGATIGPGAFKVIFADAQTSLSTPSELHTSFTLSSGSGSLALSRIYNNQAQVLDYVDYTNIGPDHSYGSIPDGQSFDRQELALATPGATNNPVLPSSFVAYTSVGAVYNQTFDALPNPGAASVNSANPVTINGIVYALANPFGFSDPVLSTGGGLGISSMAGWYGEGSVSSKFGATDGDQTTGGQISFGPANSPNRALGLLATSSTGATAFGVKFLNQTAQTLNTLSVQVTGELWRQSNLPKTLECYYFIDPTGTAPFTGTTTGLLPSLNVALPTSSAAVGGSAVDGTAGLNQTNLAIVNQPISNWVPGAALWLVWQMTDATGKAQGLAIDNFSFSASNGSAVPTPLPVAFATTATNLTLTWTGVAGLTYQIEYKTDLGAPAWTPLGSAIPGTGTPVSFTYDFSQSAQRFYRLRVGP